MARLSETRRASECFRELQLEDEENSLSCSSSLIHLLLFPLTPPPLSPPPLSPPPLSPPPLSPPPLCQKKKKFSDGRECRQATDRKRSSESLGSADGHLSTCQESIKAVFNGSVSALVSELVAFAAATEECERDILGGSRAQKEEVRVVFASPRTPAFFFSIFF